MFWNTIGGTRDKPVKAFDRLYQLFGEDSVPSWKNNFYDVRDGNPLDTVWIKDNAGINCVECIRNQKC